MRVLRCAALLSPVELMLRCACSSAVDEGFVSCGLVTLDVPEHPVGEHHYVLVTDLKVGVPTVIGKKHRGQGHCQLISPVIRCLEVEEGPHFRLGRRRGRRHVNSPHPSHHEILNSQFGPDSKALRQPVSYTHLRAHETDSYLVCRLLLEK